MGLFRRREPVDLPAWEADAHPAFVRIGREARRKLRAKNSQRMDEAWEWDRKHTRPNPEVFVQEILPLIQGVPLRRIATATGLSRHYCSLIRRGLRLPHPRHWDALHSLADTDLRS